MTHGEYVEFQDKYEEMIAQAKDTLDSYYLREFFEYIELSVEREAENLKNITINERGLI